MTQSHISQRADNFANKMRPQAPKDERSPDEKMAAFVKQYEPKAAMKDARNNVKAARPQSSNDDSWDGKPGPGHGDLTKIPDVANEAGDESLTPDQVNGKPDKWRFQHKALIASIAKKYGMSAFEDYTMVSPDRMRKFQSKRDERPVLNGS